MDRWAEWLAECRFGGDPEVRRRDRAKLALIRDQVLDRAQLRDGDHVLDVGCGEGLIAFGALERGAGAATFTDISSDLLELCRDAAAGLGVLDRCTFVQAPADDLTPIPDASVDVVTTRSVLIYVKDKPGAFREFARVLRPGGRLSVFEPINRFANDAVATTFAGYDFAGFDGVREKLRGVFEAIRPRDVDPMLDFDERDLIHLAEAAGFFPIRLTLEAVVEPLPARSWEGFLRSSPNPNAPTVADAMHQALTPAEREELGTRLRPLVEEGRGVWRMATALLAATIQPDSTSR